MGRVTVEDRAVAVRIRLDACADDHVQTTVQIEVAGDHAIEEQGGGICRAEVLVREGREGQARPVGVPGAQDRLKEAVNRLEALNSEEEIKDWWDSFNDVIKLKAGLGGVSIDFKRLLKRFRGR